MVYKIQGTEVVDSSGNIVPGDKTKFIVNEGLNITTAPPIPSPQSGSISGYNAGGLSPAVVNVIDKFSFVTDGNATDVGDLSQSRAQLAGQSSSVSGYSSGGKLPGHVNTIDKFPFVSDANATDVGDLSTGRYGVTGNSSSESGYTSGGIALTPPVVRYSSIEKFPFATEVSSSDVGDLTRIVTGHTNQASADNGYTSSGSTPSGADQKNIIDKFPFAADGNATDVGDLTVARDRAAGSSSDASGYTAGGSAPPNVNTIDKFPFASDANATDVGDLTFTSLPTGTSSRENGYASGGVSVFNIDKFPFASDSGSVDIGNLTDARYGSAGQQV